KSVAKEETEPEAKVAKEKAEPEARVAEDEGEPVAGVGGEPTSEPVVSGRFVLQAGAYLMEENLEAVSRTVERLGYRPRLDQGTKTVEMTRLKVGTYDERSARKKLQEVRRLAPDAFTLGEDGRVGVYAGSYYNLDRARVFADRLYSQGVRVEEEDVVVELPITIVRFGAFEDRSEAENVARRARDNGLEIAVVEKR
ncbi:MAG: hypothetical protein GWN87_20310, partial [Desulfuromonadales bacterium]|nr:hypothetical protein [Desulfuromonadales bacterium]